MSPSKTGILLLNLGTPDSPDTASVRRYLAEFLSDRRVIDAPRWLWLPILHGIVLNTRPRKSAHAYKQIWNTELNESPLKTFTRAQADRLRILLNDPNLTVTWAMRYGSPSTQSAIDDLIAKGCTHIIALALYPQYSHTTTASAYDAVAAALKKHAHPPTVTTLGSYYNHPLYIEALTQTAKETLDGTRGAPTGATAKRGGEAEGEGGATAPPVRDSEPQHLVVSFHGLPERYIAQGDPYRDQCLETSRLLREALNWPAERWHTAFQSRFGRAKWIEPYTATTLARLAAEGKKRVAILSPGFASDCIETLEELNIGLREAFLASGGECFTYIPCLNAQDSHIKLIANLIASAR